MPDDTDVLDGMKVYWNLEEDKDKAELAASIIQAIIEDNLLDELRDYLDEDALEALGEL